MEPNLATAETQLLADIEALRPRFPNTQDLYREVCALMFFRYGLTPTANRLYQLVRKGSMSAPAEALNRFWGQLREKSRVVIAHPDLPDELKKTAGELVASLWQSAQQAAGDSLAALREEAGREAAEARQAEDAMRQERDLLAATLADAQAQARERASHDAAAIAELRRQLAELGALHVNQTARLDEARKEINAQHAWLNSVQRDHQAELDRLRDQARLDVDKADAARRLALQEVDRERLAVKRVQQAFDTERANGSAAAERHRAELRDALGTVSALRQQVGALESTVASATAARDEARRQLDTLRADRDEALARAAGALGQVAALEAALRHAAALHEAQLAAAHGRPAPAAAAPAEPARKTRRGGRGGADQ